MYQQYQQQHIAASVAPAAASGQTTHAQNSAAAASQHPPPPPPPPSVNSVASGSAKKKKSKSSSTSSPTSHAAVGHGVCAPCAASKTKCDGARPCSRCVRGHREAACQNRAKKEHYWARQRREREERETAEREAEKAAEKAERAQQALRKSAASAQASATALQSQQHNAARPHAASAGQHMVARQPNMSSGPTVHTQATGPLHVGPPRRNSHVWNAHDLNGTSLQHEWTAAAAGELYSPLLLEQLNPHFATSVSLQRIPDPMLSPSIIPGMNYADDSPHLLGAAASPPHAMHSNGPSLGLPSPLQHASLSPPLRFERHDGNSSVINMPTFALTAHHTQPTQQQQQQQRPQPPPHTPQLRIGSDPSVVSPSPLYGGGASSLSPSAACAPPSSRTFDPIKGRASIASMITAWREEGLAEHVLGLLQSGALTGDSLEVFVTVVSEMVSPEQLVAFVEFLPVRLFLSMDSPYALAAQRIPSAVLRGKSLSVASADTHCDSPACPCRSMTAARREAFARLHTAAGSTLEDGTEPLAHASAASTSQRPFLLQPFPLWLNLEGSDGWELSASTTGHSASSRASSACGSRRRVNTATSDRPSEMLSDVPMVYLELSTPDEALDMTLPSSSSTSSPHAAAAASSSSGGPTTTCTCVTSASSLSSSTSVRERHLARSLEDLAEKQSRRREVRRRVRHKKAKMLSKVMAAIRAESASAASAAALESMAQAIVGDTTSSSDSGEEDARRKQQQQQRNGRAQGAHARAHSRSRSRSRERQHCPVHASSSGVSGPPPCCSCGVKYAHTCVPGPVRQLHSPQCTGWQQHQQQQPHRPGGAPPSSSDGAPTKFLHPPYVCRCPFVLDRPSRIHVNAAWTRMFGYSEVGFHELIRSDGLQGAFDRVSGEGERYCDWMMALVMELIIAPKQCASQRVLMRNRHGREFNTLAGAYLTRNARGDITSFVQTFTPL